MANKPVPMYTTTLSTWRDVMHTFCPAMYRACGEAQKASDGFKFPSNDSSFLTGNGGGLHFWTDLDDAVAFTRSMDYDYFYAIPRVMDAVEMQWDRDWVSLNYRPTHTVPTLILRVEGYSGARFVRDELVVPGVHDTLYRPRWIIRIML